MHALTCALSERPDPKIWDLVSGLLYQFHSQGIEEGEEPPPEGENALVAANEFEQALEPGVLAPPDRFTAYFENLRDAERAQRAIEPVLAHLKPVFDIHEVEEKNYAELWKDNFHPIDVPPNWLVRAPWHDARPTQKGGLELVIEPGMAFGTGSHETTRACLELLSEAAACKPFGPQTRILDFGCGSGILAVAAKKLGAGHVYGIDIDPLAIDATHQNAEANGVAVETGLVARPFEGLDGILANILKNTLLDFAKYFHSSLCAGGFLVLSGLLSDQEAQILPVYEELGFELKRRITQNNWVSLRLEKKQ